ncbi:lambda exonuclease family protein [Brachybacterium alimentarium]|uniref:lambda exonuclease family protein n=1 Tax=Brachybacterium alimentarium TaxID=47845 RepID=UPI003FD2FCF7
MTVTIYPELIQGSQEWIDARAGIVTASTVGKLLTSTGKVASNETSRTLTDTLITERITGRVEPIFPTRDMERGTILEPYARDLYAGHYAPVQEIGFARLDEDFYTLGASPDGLVGTDGGIEIKCPRPRTHLATLRTERVPAQYMAQIQACMHVLDRDWWDFVSYAPGLPLFVKRVDRDEVWCEAIRKACENFQITSDMDAGYHEEHVVPRFHPTEYFDPFAEEAITFG